MRSDIRCVGAFEHRGAPYLPSHVAPILVEVSRDGRWRRWDYGTESDRWILRRPIGEFVFPAESSFMRGEYLRCVRPLRMRATSQVIGCPDGTVSVVNGWLSAAALYLRLSAARPFSWHRWRACFIGIRNAFAAR